MTRRKIRNDYNRGCHEKEEFHTFSGCFTVLNCTYFHSRSPFAHHFSPVLPTLLVRPRPTLSLSGPEPLWVHPRSTRTDLACLRRSLRGPSGETTATLIYFQNC